MAEEYDSIREQIAAAVQTRLEGMTTDNYAFAFSHVQRSDLESSIKGKEYVAGVFDDIEEKRPDTDPVVRCTLRVDIEFQVYISASENPRTKINKVYSETERAIMSDRTFGGLAIDTNVLGSETSIQSRFDKYVEGLLRLSISYRHRNTDPRAAI